MLRLFKNGEISIDFNQWMIGLNYYDWIGLNIFLGPIRFQFYSKKYKYDFISKGS